MPVRATTDGSGSLDGQTLNHESGTAWEDRPPTSEKVRPYAARGKSLEGYHKKGLPAGEAFAQEEEELPVNDPFYSTSGSSPPEGCPNLRVRHDLQPLPEELVEALATLLAQALVNDMRQYPDLPHLTPTGASATA